MGIYFLTNAFIVHSFMSRSDNSENALVPDEAVSSEKVRRYKFTGYSLLLNDDHKNFGSSLVLDFRK